MSLEANSALIVAALDLNLVRLLRQAMRVADLTVAAERPIHQTANEPCCHDQRCCPCPENAAAPAAPLIAAVDRYEPSNTVIVSHPSRPLPGPAAPQCVEVVVVRDRDSLESPLQPPWKVLPWENPAQPAQKIKVVHYPPDTVCKGTVLDCFI